jgi:hypothetical protein
MPTVSFLPVSSVLGLVVGLRAVFVCEWWREDEEARAES